MVPPKDPYICVRVLDDIREVCLGDHSISLTKHSLHFLRRTDAEQFISQVCYCRVRLISMSTFLPNAELLFKILGSDGRVSGVESSVMTGDGNSLPFVVFPKILLF